MLRPPPRAYGARVRVGGGDRRGWGLVRQSAGSAASLWRRFPDRGRDAPSSRVDRRRRPSLHGADARTSGSRHRQGRGGRCLLRPARAGGPWRRPQGERRARHGRGARPRSGADGAGTRAPPGGARRPTDREHPRRNRGRATGAWGARAVLGDRWTARWREAGRRTMTPSETTRLDAQTAALVRVAAAVAQGHVPELKTRLAAARSAGVPPRWIEELLLQSMLVVGYPLSPVAVAALRVVGGS